MKKTAVIWFTSAGAELAERVGHLPELDILEYHREAQPAKDFVREAFSKCDQILFISAVGIAVRMIAPYIRSKDSDPAVVVMDDAGQYAISLLSGHLGGANELTKYLSAHLGAQAIITTSTDVHGVFAVDVWSQKAGCVIGEVPRIKWISSALLEGTSVGFMSDYPVSGLPECLREGDGELGICVSLDEWKSPFPRTLHIIPHILSVGVGCRKQLDSTVFENTVLEILREHRISLRAVRRIASIDIKREEPCIQYFCQKYEIPFQTFSAEELSQVAGDFTPSDFVKKTVGVENVCERSAVLGLAGKGSLLIKKQARNGVTVAVACENWRCVF